MFPFHLHAVLSSNDTYGAVGEKIGMSAMKCFLTATTEASTSEDYLFQQVYLRHLQGRTRLVSYFNSHPGKFSQTVFFNLPLAENIAVFPDCINNSTVERKIFVLPHLDKFSPALLQVLAAFNMSDPTVFNLHT